MIIVEEREVPSYSAEKKLKWFGYRCQVCASTDALEVVMGKAAMNGGTPAPDNLYPLCLECRLTKMELDKRLNRKLRESGVRFGSMR